MLKYCTVLDHRKISHFRYGQLHHIDRPARIYSDSERYYVQYGEFHNEHGPACLSLDDKYKVYYVRGKFCTRDKYKEYVKI